MKYAVDLYRLIFVWRIYCSEWSETRS